MMYLEINGIKFEGFVSSSLSRSIDEVSGRFDFVATSDVIDDFTSAYPVKKNSIAKVLIDNTTVLTGYVDIIEPSYGSKSHTINIIGRSKTSELVSSSVWGQKVFKQPIDFITIAKKVISDLGSSIKVVNEFGPIEKFTQDVSAEIGEGAFTFLERLSRKRQILLTSNGDGDLVLTRASSQRLTTILLKQKGNNESNVLSASARYDFTKRYNEIKVVGQASPFAGIGNDLQSNSNGASAIDSDALSTKKLIIIADQEIDLKTADEYAKWESNIRRANSQIYKPTIQGHYHADGLWDINQFVSVYDDVVDIESDMLIKSIDSTWSNEGAFSKMVLVSPDAYTLQTERSTFEKAVNQIGVGFA